MDSEPTAAPPLASAPLASTPSAAAEKPTSAASDTDLPNPTGRNLTWRVIQICCAIGFAVYFRFAQRGRERLPNGGALLIANHQSFVDPLLMGVALKRPISFLARDSLFRVPIVGWILRSTYVMPIRRESAGSVREPIRRLKHGFYVGVFPEGTRTEDGSVGDFKPGFISLIRRAKVPVVPVGIAGAFEAYPRDRKFPRPGRIRVVYGDAIPADEAVALAAKGNEQALLDRLHDSVAQLAAEAQQLR